MNPSVLKRNTVVLMEVFLRRYATYRDQDTSSASMSSASTASSSSPQAAPTTPTRRGGRRDGMQGGSPGRTRAPINKQWATQLELVAVNYLFEVPDEVEQRREEDVDF